MHGSFKKFETYQIKSKAKKSQIVNWNPEIKFQNSSHGPPNPKNKNTTCKANSTPETRRNRDSNTGMYLNFRRGGSSGIAITAAVSLAELLSALLPLLPLCEIGVHLYRRRWETLLPLLLPLVWEWWLEALDGETWTHFFFHFLTGPVKTVAGP